MEEYKHTIFEALIKWKNKELDTETKLKALSAVQPVIDSLITKKVLTEEEKAKIQNKTETFSHTLNQHFSALDKNIKNLE